MPKRSGAATDHLRCSVPDLDGSRCLGLSCAGRLKAPLVFRQLERISKVETGLVRLEVTVEQLANTMAGEHRTNQETRKEDRMELREHIGRMEKSVVGLADEMKKIAERTSTVDSNVLSKQSQASGALDTAKWIIGTLIGLSALIMAYQQGERNDYVPPEGHYRERAR